MLLLKASSLSSVYRLDVVVVVLVMLLLLIANVSNLQIQSSIIMADRGDSSLREVSRNAATHDMEQMFSHGDSSPLVE